MNWIEIYGNGNKFALDKLLIAYSRGVHLDVTENYWKITLSTGMQAYGQAQKVTLGRNSHSKKAVNKLEWSVSKLIVLY